MFEGVLSELKIRRDEIYFEFRSLLGLGIPSHSEIKPQSIDKLVVKPREIESAENTQFQKILDGTKYKKEFEEKLSG